ncbi:MAG: DUF1573 domain-containing protein [Bacteroidia bacterium]|nr:DUF1573 domain-containing protein [Bacteroidia bacterium]
MFRVLILFFTFLTLGTCSLFAQLMIFPTRIYPTEKNASTATSEVKSEASWISKFFDFGYVPVGSAQTFRFQFRNTGGKPLRITGATSNCSCMVVNEPSTAILPDKNGMVEIKLSPVSTGNLNCYITLVTNTREVIETLSVSAIVY